MPSKTRATKSAAKKTAVAKKIAPKTEPVSPAAPPRKKKTVAAAAAKKATRAVATKVARKAAAAAPATAAKKKVASKAATPVRVTATAVKAKAATSTASATAVPRATGRKMVARAKREVPSSAPAELASRSRRRTIFIDVENTSDEAELAAALDQLAIDRLAQPTDIVAVGNWRVAGQRMGRRLAALGVQLVHSAPATGVRDWSDLWIAVAAGMRIGRGEPGDTLEIISDDKAFDAVGDAAASLGIAFRRIALHKPRAAAPVAATKAPRRRRRGGRGARAAVDSGGVHARAATAPAPAPADPVAAPSPAPAPPAVGEVEPHTASHEQILEIIDRLAKGDRNRWVNLDVLANELKKEGFGRPPGSLRLVTRLRKFADVEVSPSGAVRHRTHPGVAGE